MTTQVNLHNHTDGSLLDGLSSVTAAAARAKEVGSDALSITDHNEVNQHLAFQKACEAIDIKPVLGMEADWVYDIAWTRENLHYPTNRSHMCLLAKDNEGLSNLWKLSTLAYTDEHRYYKPLISTAMMREYSAGLYASDGCLLTEMSRAVQRGDEELARQHFAALRDIFGDRFYCELHTWQFINPAPTDTVTWEKQVITAAAANQIATAVNQVKVRLATEFGVPMVVVNDSHHPSPDLWFNKELVWKYSTSNKKKGEDDQQIDAVLQKADHIMGAEEIYGWMGLHGIGADIVTEAIKNSHELAHSCTATIGKTLDMPRMNATDNDDMRQLLAEVQKGFVAKVEAEGLPADIYFQRVETELKLISDKGFAGYFLMVQDEVDAAVTGRYAPYIENGAPFKPQLVGCGRGSAGGSLVAWLTGITSIDPIHYDLLFERFLAPGRKGFPDIDVDVPQEQRHDEKEYLSARYGHDHVCSIGTVTHSQAKGLLKDLCRAMQIPLRDANVMSKIVEQVKGVETEDGTEEGLSWADVVEKKGGDLASWAAKHPLLFEKVRQMDNIIRTTGVHPSGVVVANKPLLGSIPMRSRPKDGMTVTQLDMYDVEELGAVKLDILGLRHLDTLMTARNLIYERHGVWLDFRRDHLPSNLRGAIGAEKPSTETVVTFGYDHYSDPDIWPQIDAGGTTGIFQINTPGLTRTGQQLKPRNERDVAALISIVRPGVKDAMLDQVYLMRRAGLEKVVYDHPLMEAITSETYGVLIYQEQLLRAARDIAGFTPDEGSDLQKALSKKWMDKVVAFKDKFITNAQVHPGLTGEIAAKIWYSIEASGRYAFNKCTIGSTRVRLSASSQHSDGTMTIADMWRRLNDTSRLEGRPCWYGCFHTGYKGQCQTCRVWRGKFRDPRQGLKGWSLGEGGRLHPNRIIDVHQNGVRPVWKVTLADGRSITTTENHRHRTPAGWREVRNLSVGDLLLVCGEYEGQVWEPDKVRTTSSDPDYHGAKLPNHLRHGVDSLGYRDGGHLALKEWTEEQEWACNEPGCTRSRAAGDRIERAHLDGNRLNNDPSNLAMKCASHHKAHDYRANGRRRRGEKGYPVIPQVIVSIEPVGEEMTYDLEMETPYHSWVANDIVTHNSHAVGYSIIACWEIWTKHYYPHEMLVAMMATDPENINSYVREARRRGITILPPDINHSGRRFTIVGDEIRYGLDSIKGVGDAAVIKILKTRPFISLEDLITKSGLGKTQMEALICIGACDDMMGAAQDGAARGTIESIAHARSNAMVSYHDKRILDKVAEGKRAKFTPEDEVIHVAAWRDKHRGEPAYEAEFIVPDFSDPAVVYAIEQQLVGNYVTQDPMGHYEDTLNNYGAITETEQLFEFQRNEEFVIGGQVTSVSTTKIKKAGRNQGKEMAFIVVTRNEQDFEITVFTEAWEANWTLLEEGAPVACVVIRDGRGCNLKVLQRLDAAVSV